MFLKDAKSSVGIIPLVTALFLVTACSTDKRESGEAPKTTLAVYCQSTEDLIDNLIDAAIEENPPKTIVATDEYVTVRDRSCESAVEAP